MRIISGIFKGKKIYEPEDLETRPLKDLTKESIFNIINHSNKFQVNLKNANVLDLFSAVLLELNAYLEVLIKLFLLKIIKKFYQF